MRTVHFDNLIILYVITLNFIILNRLIVVYQFLHIVVYVPKFGTVSPLHAYMYICNNISHKVTVTVTSCGRQCFGYHRHVGGILCGRKVCMLLLCIIMHMLPYACVQTVVCRVTLQRHRDGL